MSFSVSISNSKYTFTKLDSDLTKDLVFDIAFHLGNI